jgi:hypothetical protein
MGIPLTTTTKTVLKAK